jgi:hypothetical protein
MVFLDSAGTALDGGEFRDFAVSLAPGQSLSKHFALHAEGTDGFARFARLGCFVQSVTFSDKAVWYDRAHNAWAP